MAFFNSFSRFLNDSVGNMLANNPDDVRATKRNFASLGRFDADVDNGFITKELDTSIRNFQRDEGLKVDGLMNPDGETERAVSQRLSGGSPPFSPLFLSDSVGKMKANHPQDVKQVQRNLGHLSRMPAAAMFEPSGILDTLTDLGVRAFQRDKGLKEDGILYPDGKTQNVMNDVLFSRRAADGDAEVEDEFENQGGSDDLPENSDKPPILPHKLEPPEDPKILSNRKEIVVHWLKLLSRLDKN